MPGGFDPFPRRPGGRRGRNIEVLTQSVHAQRGTAYSQSTNSFVWLESHVIARCIAESWETNQRLANQFDPYRATDFLPRWERIYGIVPPFGANESQRRAAVAARWILAGKKATPLGMEDVLRTLLPNTFVRVHYLPNRWAFDRTPEDVLAGGTNTPLGTHPSAGTDPTNSNAPGNWSSTVHHVAIELQQPSWMSDAAYHLEAKAIYSGVLDAFLPSWTTFSAFKGPTLGFFLDAAGNLDNQAIGIVSYGELVINGGAITRPILPYLFVAGATGGDPAGDVYANFYGLTIGSPTAVTISLSTGTATDTWGVLRSGTDPYAGATISSFPSSDSRTLAAGSYTLEVSDNGPDTFGASPGTVIVQITSP